MLESFTTHPDGSKLTEIEEQSLVVVSKSSKATSLAGDLNKCNSEWSSPNSTSSIFLHAVVLWTGSAFCGFSWSSIITSRLRFDDDACVRTPVCPVFPDFRLAALKISFSLCASTISSSSLWLALRIKRVLESVLD